MKQSKVQYRDDQNKIYLQTIFFKRLITEKLFETFRAGKLFLQQNFFFKDIGIENRKWGNCLEEKLFGPQNNFFSKLPGLKIENPRKIVWAKNCLAGEIDQIVTKQFFFSNAAELKGENCFWKSEKTIRGNNFFSKHLGIDDERGNFILVTPVVEPPCFSGVGLGGFQKNPNW